jgi:hypothetical protein
VKFGPRKKMLTWPDEWGPHVSEIREKKKIPIRVELAGRGLLLLLGRIGFPGSIYIFILFFSFCFFVFFILLYLLQKCFKSTETTFRNFLKFKVSKWDSRNRFS